MTGVDRNGRPIHECPECEEIALWEGPDAGYWMCDECGRRYSGSLENLTLMELYTDGGTPPSGMEREDYRCADCSEKYHTELGATGHAAAQGHRVANIRTGEVLK
ncbi:hypothetical protein ACFQO4_20920 [Saliphagus sp. GCM10025334]